MKTRAMLSLLLIPLAPTLGSTQQTLARAPAPLGIDSRAGMRHVAVSARPLSVDSTRSTFDRNVIRAAALGGIIGGVIGAVASEHQAVGAGFTHTPAVLFVATYGGLGVLLGLIAGTMLPGT